MGLAVPWAILAALAVGALTRRLDRNTRNLALVLSICLLGATSVRWFSRELQLARLDVSNTTTHHVYLGIDTTQIVKYLNENKKDRTVVVAMPGTPLPDLQNPGSFVAPYLPDLNPILSGLTGVYTYAGHWSETPDYLQRRSIETAFFLKTVTDEQRRVFLGQIQADYIVAPVPQTFPLLSLDDVSELGEVVYNGQQFRLVRVR
jgi:arabinosyltransferase C